jgi:hypothetical protein
MKRILCLSLFALLGLMPFKAALAQIAISVNFAPPALPVYEQPPCPEDGSIWVPGYWAWDPDYEDYYWVPGTWVPAPEPGYLWTPPWWGWENGAYLFHAGYWAPEVGFYGGVNYGYGYFGHGFEGGRWDHNHFYYNRAVMNVNTTVIRNVYVDKTVIVNNNVHVSYNGGQGGIEARPTQREEAVAQMRHVPPPAQQEQRREMARSNPQMRASVNQGRPPVAATARPTDFKGRGVVQARAAGAPYHPPANRAQPRPENARPGNESARPEENNRAPTHASELPPHQAPPAEGNSAADRQYQQEQQKLAERQNQEHQKLAQQQQKEDQRAQQQHYNEQRQQQMEQRHQQQTQQMQQRHQQEQRQMQQRRPEQQRPPQRPPR